MCIYIYIYTHTYIHTYIHTDMAMARKSIAVVSTVVIIILRRLQIIGGFAHRNRDICFGLGKV